MPSQVVSRLGATILAAAALTLVAGVELAAAQSSSVDEVVNPSGVAQKLELTPAQRGAIYQEVSKNKSKVASSRFPRHRRRRSAADDRAIHAARRRSRGQPGHQIVQIHDGAGSGRIVDPTNMRTIAVIGPKRNQ